MPKPGFTLYTVGKDLYEVSDSDAKAFETEYPDASVRYTTDEYDFDIPISDRSAFLKDVPNARLSTSDEVSWNPNRRHNWYPTTTNPYKDVSYDKLISEKEAKSAEYDFVKEYESKQNEYNSAEDYLDAGDYDSWRKANSYADFITSNKRKYEDTKRDLDFISRAIAESPEKKEIEKKILDNTYALDKEITDTGNKYYSEHGSLSATPSITGGGSFMIPSSDKNNSSASMFNQRTREVLRQRSIADDKSGWSNYWKGTGDRITTADWLTRGLSEAIDYINVRSLQEKMRDIEESVEEYKDSPNFEAKVDEQMNTLTDGEKNLLRAYMNYGYALEMRKDDVPLSYRSGQMFADTAGYMIDFLLTNDAAAIGKSAARKAMGDWATKNVFGKLLTTAAGAATRTPAMVGPTLQTIGQNLVEMENIKNENGEVVGSQLKRSIGNSIANGLFTQFVGNWTEEWGDILSDEIGNVIQGAFKQSMAPSTTIGRNTKEWLRGVGGFLKKGQFHGMLYEDLEEVFNAALEAAAGAISGDKIGDSGSLYHKDPETGKVTGIFSAESQAELLLGFLPMTALSTLGSLKAAQRVERRYDEGMAAWNKMVEEGLGITNEDLSRIIDNIENKSFDELNKSVGDLYKKIRTGSEAQGVKHSEGEVRDMMNKIIEGQLAHDLQGDLWMESQERVDLADAYGSLYGAPLEDNLYDTTTAVNKASQAALEVGFSEEDIVGDPAALMREAIDIAENGGANSEAKSMALYDLAIAKATQQGIDDGWQESVKKQADGAKAQIEKASSNGYVATAMYNGKPVIVLNDDSGITIDGDTRKVSINGADGLVPVRDASGNTLTDEEGNVISFVKASLLSDADLYETAEYAKEYESIITEYAQQLYDLAQNAISVRGMAEAVMPLENHSVLLMGENGQGSVATVLAVSPEQFTVTVQDASGDGNISTVGIDTFYNMAQKDDAGNIVLDPTAKDNQMGASSPERKAPKAQKQPAVQAPSHTPTPEPVQAPTITELPKNIIGSTVNVTLNGVPMSVSVTEVTNDGKVVYDVLDEDGEAIKSEETDSASFARGLQEAQAPQPAEGSALSRIPKDTEGNPIYEQTDSDTAWDAIVEQTGGDEKIAKSVAESMLADKEAALKNAEKAKAKPGVTIAEKIAAEKERNNAIEAAKRDVEAWKKIADTAQRRKLDAEAQAEQTKEDAKKKKTGAEEAARTEKEALNGVPDVVDDTPKDARARGYRRVSGHKIDRQQPLEHIQGKEVSVKFSDDTIKDGHVAVIDVNYLQPSHINGQRNPLHFIDEAQPKERKDNASMFAAAKIASTIRPEEITSSVTAYTGAPSVNSRGEIIQGNNRGAALREMWKKYEEQAAIYKQYLIDHADEFGLSAADIEAMERPVLVNMLDVEDDEAINLGQYVAQDTESGGVERIKPKNVVMKMGSEMGSFASILLQATDDETSFAGLVDMNGEEALKWLLQKGFITPTQYQSAFDSKGNLTAEAKNDIKGIMYQGIFTGGSTKLEEMFNLLPAKAQKAILSTAYRDYDSPESERMTGEIRNSIMAFYYLSLDKDFAAAKNFKDARMAVEAWKMQTVMDDVTGESYLPSEKFNNFALHLATMYKGNTQSLIQGTFNKLFDLIQGTQETTLFEQPDNTPRSLAQAIKEALNIEYNGQYGSNVLADNTPAEERGQSGSSGNAESGERAKGGKRTADNTGGTEGGNEQGEVGSEGNAPKAEIPKSEKPKEIDSVGDVEKGVRSDVKLEELINSQATLVLNDGRRANVLYVTHSGEQIGVSKYSKPIITRIYGVDENGQTFDFAPEGVDINASILYNKESQEHEKNSGKEEKSDKNIVSSIPEDASVEITPEEKKARTLFRDSVGQEMLQALETGDRPFRSIIDLRKRAKESGMQIDDDGQSDILLQELVEDALVRSARQVIASGEYGESKSKTAFDAICRLYDMQPTITQRSSNRIKMQQYSTPLPMSFVADMFAYVPGKTGTVLEPTAGNGMLVFGIPASIIHVNELDKVRFNNLRGQGYGMVTSQDATKPIREGKKLYDAVIANPPFGNSEAKIYDGKSISGLDPQITLNALSNMKDNGRAAIIIGGNLEYSSNGAIKSKKQFFTYLYDHYNVKGVIDMSGKLYQRQGTTYPTMMILIDGRRSEEERLQTTVYPPVKDNAIGLVESFDDLYNTVNEILASKDKTNGTEILRTQELGLSDDNRTSRRALKERHRVESNEDAGNGEGKSISGGSNRTSRQDGGKGVQGTGRTGNRAAGQSGDAGISSSEGDKAGDGFTADRGANGDSGRTRSSSMPNGGTRQLDGERTGAVGASSNGVGLVKHPEKEKKEGRRDINEEKLNYRPHSGAFSLESVAPAAMVDAMDKTLAKIEEQYGPIDEFVRTELGYDTIQDVYNALAAEQVDSVAMAIYQMKRGQALIIGDQTGVGKGRQMAALIRWAVRQGTQPIFITQKSDLFSDIYRDLVDIGSGDLCPFIFNSDGAMVDANGRTVYKPLSTSEQDKIFATGKLPDKYDYAVLTYSQVNTGDAISAEEAKKAAGGKWSKKGKNIKEGKPTPKATFLRAIAKDNYLFLDESHTAAGQSNTGAYLQSITKSASAVTFASATFAKRPDTMPLYALRTAMSQAQMDDKNDLISVIEKGGVTLQEIMSRALTESGQMVRRERDMSDVRTDWETITDPETVRIARENYDKTITAFNAIIKFQNDFVKPMIESLSSALAVRAESADVKKGTNKMGIDNVPFASKTYNYTKQLMLALKVDAIVNRVVDEIKAGRHPVIALESTMESIISDYAPGEEIKEPTFSASLLKGLESVMQYTVKDADGNESHERYSPRDLGAEGEKEYYRLQELIRESTKGIFISPLDAIIDKLHRQGYKVGELTGRNMYVEISDSGKAIVQRRVDKDKKKMQRDFNSGVLDVLILNKSASTGISLHASKMFADRRQRSMIIAQPLSDINDYMQMIGRIDRTGQVSRGYYINLALPVPAEQRFNMMLSTKLKSLNANTTTSQDSESSSVDAPDLLNKYGSQVVVEYLRDNPDIYRKMGEPLKEGTMGGGKVVAEKLDEYKPNEDDARKITGYVALLSTKEQEDFYDDVIRRYNELIQYLNDSGTNDLKITVMPLRAETLDRKVSSEGIDPNGDNPFAQNAYVERVSMDVLRKPMKADEVRKLIDTVNEGMDPSERMKARMETLRGEVESKLKSEDLRYEKDKARLADEVARKTDIINARQKMSEDDKKRAITEYIESETEKVETRHNTQREKIKTTGNQLYNKLVKGSFKVGDTYLIPDDINSLTPSLLPPTPAIFVGYKMKESKISASTTFAVFATLDGRRRIEVKLSQERILQNIRDITFLNYDTARQTTLENWDSQIPSGSREEGYIMTGNILQAIADTRDDYGSFPGQLVTYTDIDGNVHDGILMPRNWNPGLLRSAASPISSKITEIENGNTVISTDGDVEIMPTRLWEMGKNSMHYLLRVPKTKSAGGKYFGNEELLELAKNHNFVTRRGKMEAQISANNIKEVVSVLSRMGVKVRAESPINEGETEQVRYREANVVDGEPSPLILAQMNAKLDSMSESLGTPIKRVTSQDMPKGHEADKGYFNTETGEVVVCTDNVTSMRDAMATVFHEAVGHLGLRNLLGDKFGEAMQQIYANLDDKGRAWVASYMQRRGWKPGETDKVVYAMEEYLSKLAESGDFKGAERSLWQRIKDVFARAIDDLFGTDFFTFTDNELNYILRASYENLVDPNYLSKVKGWARDVLLRRELAINEYDPNAPVDPNSPDGPDSGNRFRDNDSGVAKIEYEEDMRDWRNTAIMEHQNSMQPVKIGMERVMKEVGKTALSESEDYLTKDNLASSKADTEAHEFELFYFTPLLEHVRKIQHKLVGRDGSSSTRVHAYERILDYLYRVSGLERNEYKNDEIDQMCNELIGKAKNAYTKQRLEIEFNPALTNEQKEERVAKLDAEFENTVKSLTEEYEAKKRDWAGLSGLEGTFNQEALNALIPNPTDSAKKRRQFSEQREALKRQWWIEAEEKARAEVEAFKQDVGDDAMLDELWRLIRSATDYNLDHAYSHGLLTKDEYERLHGTETTPRMWNYYLPLRGFSEQTAEQAYDYSNIVHPSSNSVVVKKMDGRWSKADNPLANLLNIAETEIVQGNNNIAKQALYRFVLNAGENTLLSLSNAWYEKDPSTGTWALAEPYENESFDEFEKRMQALHDNIQPDGSNGSPLAKKGRRGLNMDKIITSPGHRNEHLIRLKVGGQEKMIWVNGNPAFAQAVAGQNRANNMRLIRKVSRTLSNLFTTYSLDFTARNLMRDTIYSRFAIMAKEDKAYRKQFGKNWKKNFGYGAFAYPMIKLMVGWENGSLVKKQNKTAREQLFIDFMRDGGQTGYTIVNSVDTIKKDLERSMRKAGQKVNTISIPILGHYALCVKTLNEAFELLTRFTAYQTSRDMGRSGQRSASDAKEISVNFNRKGAQTGDGFWGATAAWLGATHYFYNAGVQGFDNLMHLFKTSPMKMTATGAGFVLLGILTPMINSLIAGLADGLGDGDDDGDQWYWELPQWVRRNNLVLGTGKFYISVPLPVEYRAVYGLGDIASSLMYDKVSGGNAFTIGLDAINTAAGILPINPIEDYSSSGNISDGVLRTLFPDAGMFIVDIATNRDFTGRPLYKENPFSKTLPKSQAVYASTPEYLVKATQALAKATSNAPIFIDPAPGIWRNIFKNFGGGFYKTAEDVARMFMSDDEHPFRWENMPFISGFTGHIDEDRSNTFETGALNDYKNVSEEVIRRLNAATGGSEVTARMAYEDPDSLPDEAKVQAILEGRDYELGKIYYRGMHNTYGKNSKGNITRSKNYLEKKGVETLRKEWMDLRDRYFSETDAERKAEMKLAVQDAWQAYYDAQGNLCEELLEYENKTSLLHMQNTQGKVYNWAKRLVE